jgi:beta-galactosidase
MLPLIETVAAAPPLVPPLPMRTGAAGSLGVRLRAHYRDRWRALPRKASATVVVAMAMVMGAAGPLEAQAPARAAAPESPVRIANDASGIRLLVHGQPFMVKGVNWDYFPIGTTTTYNFWGQPDAFIREALDREMGLLQAMGGNAIRAYVGIPARWIEYIHDNFGIWTIVNHPVGRYGVTLDGRYVPATDYSNPRVRALLRAEVEAMVEELVGARGLLLWLLGNENNYGLEWRSAETENLPEGERFQVMARYLYSLMGDVVDAVKAIDPHTPVAMANGDLQYLSIIAEEVSNLDVFGSNVYRGMTFTDLFERVDEAMGIPVLFTEFGADAFHAVNFREDQGMQARYLISQWHHIYREAAGQGGIGNAIGGAVFQWSDGWWKHLQTERLDIHDTFASWGNDAYAEDYVPGENNMNEEWWGIMAKGPTDARGHFDLYPRAAYYALRDIFALDPYAPSTDGDRIARHFAGISPLEAELTARGDRAGLLGARTSVARLTGVRMDLETYSTGGVRVRTPEDRQVGQSDRPAFRGFDTKQSFFVDAQVTPAPNVVADLSINILGAVPDNPIDEIFYESVGRQRRVPADGGTLLLADNERVRVYRGSLSWDDRNFRLDAFYRSGHYHWGYEGDFFNLYREANYGPNVDIYNGVAPVGFEWAGKRRWDGLKVAFGPELWWGANPAVLAKYTRALGRFTMTGLFHEDIASQREVTSSFAIPTPPTRRGTLHLRTNWRSVDLDLGGIWGGAPRVGETFQIVRGGPGAYEVLLDEVRTGDTFGAKAKATFALGRVSGYVLGSSTGLVAEGGSDQTQTFTGWRLKDNGSGNQRLILGGFIYGVGHLTIAPNFLWQQPIVGPVPVDAPAPARPRNILDDPFAVRVNRETTAAELLFTWDPTPATWMYAWDSDRQEDAGFALSAGVVFRRHATTADAAIGILADGMTTFAFPGGTPARDLWEFHARLVSKWGGSDGIILNPYWGQGEPNGSDARLVTRYGTDLRVIRGPARFAGFIKVDDWGPFDYHRDFNLTFPLQLMGDLSWTLGRPDWFETPMTRLGLRATWRSLDAFSPRYCPDDTDRAGGGRVCNPLPDAPRGNEWEIRTYLQIAM